MEASYRTKAQKHYKGYVANITETCDPDNDVQLITKVQIAPNNVDDTQLLAEVLPELKERTDLDTLYTDGGYGSSEIDDAMAENNVEQVQTAIRGRKPSSEKLHLSDFEMKQTEEGKPTQITCPQGQKVKVQLSNRKKALWLTLKKTTVRPAHMYRSVRPNQVNVILTGIYGLHKLRPMSPKGAGGVKPV